MTPKASPREETITAAHAGAVNGRRGRKGARGGKDADSKAREDQSGKLPESAEDARGGGAGGGKSREEEEEEEEDPSLLLRAGRREAEGGCGHSTFSPIPSIPDDDFLSQHTENVNSLLNEVWSAVVLSRGADEESKLETAEPFSSSSSHSSTTSSLSVLRDESDSTHCSVTSSAVKVDRSSKASSNLPADFLSAKRLSGDEKQKLPSFRLPGGRESGRYHKARGEGGMKQDVICSSGCDLKQFDLQPLLKTKEADDHYSCCLCQPLRIADGVEEKEEDDDDDDEKKKKEKKEKKKQKQETQTRDGRSQRTVKLKAGNTSEALRRRSKLVHFYLRICAASFCVSDSVKVATAKSKRICVGLLDLQRAVVSLYGEKLEECGNWLLCVMPIEDASEEEGDDPQQLVSSSSAAAAEVRLIASPKSLRKRTNFGFLSSHSSTPFSAVDAFIPTWRERLLLLFPSISSSELSPNVEFSAKTASRFPIAADRANPLHGAMRLRPNMQRYEMLQVALDVFALYRHWLAGTLSTGTCSSFPHNALFSVPEDHRVDRKQEQHTDVQTLQWALSSIRAFQLLGEMYFSLPQLRPDVKVVSPSPSQEGHHGARLLPPQLVPPHYLSAPQQLAKQTAASDDEASMVKKFGEVEKSFGMASQKTTALPSLETSSNDGVGGTASFSSIVSLVQRVCAEAGRRADEAAAAERRGVFWCLYVELAKAALECGWSLKSRLGCVVSSFSSSSSSSASGRIQYGTMACDDGRQVEQRSEHFQTNSAIAKGKQSDSCVNDAATAAVRTTATFPDVATESPAGFPRHAAENRETEEDVVYVGRRTGIQLVSSSRHSLNNSTDKQLLLLRVCHSHRKRRRPTDQSFGFHHSANAATIPDSSVFNSAVKSNAALKVLSDSLRLCRPPLSLGLTLILQKRHTWRVWLLIIVLDVLASSLQLAMQIPSADLLNTVHRIETLRRLRRSLWLALLRPPFFDRFLLSFARRLDDLLKRVPLLSLFNGVDAFLALRNCYFCTSGT